MVFSIYETAEFHFCSDLFIAGRAALFSSGGERNPDITRSNVKQGQWKTHFDLEASILSLKQKFMLENDIKLLKNNRENLHRFSFY